MRVSRLTMASAALAIALISPTITAAQELTRDQQICAAGLKSYFFLDTLPSLEVPSTQPDDFHRFRSIAGYGYKCRISGEQVIFEWVNAANATMTSSSTTFAIVNDTLLINTDMKIDMYPAPQ